LLIKIKKLKEGIKLPEYKTAGSAGMDLYTPEEFVLEPGQILKVPLGFSVEVPEGYEMQIRSRSSMAAAGVTVANQPGTIDSDYRGEVAVLLLNLQPNHVVFPKGERIAQAIVAPYIRVEWDESLILTDTIRGEGGFGSTGSN
jgi:dUTP pyrophosphatase